MDDNKYTILAVDDAKDTLMLLEQDLVDAGYRVITAESGESALKQLESFVVDMILLDMYMPGMTGLEVLKTIKPQERFNHIPVIMLSTCDDEDQFVAALEYGADDFVTKPYIAKVLLARIRNSFRLMEKTQELEMLAKIDFLTGINNRGNFEKLTYASINQCRRMEQNLVLGIFDLDFFKNVNDVYGHSAGDEVLVEFSKLLQLCFREYDVVGRVGGEEFGVCLPNTDISDAIYACERVRAKLALKQFSFSNENKVNVTVSAGLADAKGKDINYETLFKRADCALYKAKTSGRNCIVFDCNDVDDENPRCNKAIKKCEHHKLDVERQVQPLLNETVQNITPEIEMENMTNTENNLANEKYPGIDYNIGVNNVLGDDSLFAEILLMFVDDHGEDSEKLSQAIKNDDYETLKHVTHTLKGVACSVGAMDLFEVTRDLDHAINAKKSSDYEALYLLVHQALTKVIDGIKQRLG